MVRRTDIRRWSGAASYDKGLDVYYASKVQNLEVEENRGTVDIKAMVSGSRRSRYRVSLSLNQADNILEEYNCDCPAFYNFSGICKHCVAALLEYMDYEARQDMQQRTEEIRQRSLEILKGIKGVKIPVEPEGYGAVQQKDSRGVITQIQPNSMKEKPKITTAALKKLLNQQAVIRALPVMQEDTYGKVQLEPHLVCTTDKMTLEFKIGITQMYILKDVVEFAERVRNQTNYQYGKKLEFVHSMGAFTEESQSYVNFLCNWVSHNRERQQRADYYAYSAYSYGKIREIPLKTRDLEDFLLAAGEWKFLASINWRGEELWQVAKGQNLKRSMTITGEKDGIQIKINNVTGWQGTRYYIYFHKNRVYMEEISRLASIREFIMTMGSIPKKTAFIEKADVPVFCRDLLPEIEKFYQCEKMNFSEEDYGVVPATFKIYLDSPEMNVVTANVFALYGEKRFSVYKNKTEQNHRDLAQEALVGKEVGNFFNAYDEKNGLMVLAEDEDKLYELMTVGIAQLQKLGEVYISNTMKKLKVREAPKVSVGVSLSGDLLELHMTSDDMPMEELMEILSRYNKKKKFFRLKNGDFVNAENEGIKALMELKEGLNLTDSQMKQQNLQLPKYRALYLDAELKEHQALPVTKDRAFKALVRNMKTVEDNDFEIPASLDKILREYQKRGFLWLKTLKYNGFGGILADDMGLGKTLQVIAFLLAEYREAKPEENKRCLVVSPASLVYNWNSELEKFAPELPVKMVIGTGEERKRLIESASEREILLTSYDLLKRDIACYGNIKFDTQVIDEAQYIKNYATQAAKAVKEIDAGFKLALTGTPVENRLSELWSIFDYLMPRFLYTYARFREELEARIVQNQDENAMKRLQKMIRPFVLRRLKKEVLTDLPDKLEKNLYAQLVGEQQKLYDAHVKRMKLMLDKQSEEEFKTSKIQILSELTRLRQICCDPTLVFEDYKGESSKEEMCIDLILNAVGSGHKILLFSQFTTMLEHLQERLKTEGISFYTLTGATSKEKRAKLVDSFNQDDTSVFCISLKAGGTGLNLTAADIVIHYDPWWNVAVQNQATDRAHRIGQKNVVSVYKLVVKGTIEENIMKLQEKKKELADQVLSGDGIGAGSFTREELMELLR